MSESLDKARQWWDLKAPKEETDRADEAVNRALRWREIEKHLAGVRTIAEIGGGTGVFSIPLARRGFEVTHVDFSRAMLDVARQKADELPGIRFVQADAADLSAFADRSFDLVLNMDGAISFSGRLADQCIREACRIARGTVIVTVSNQASLLAGWVNASIQVAGDILPAVYSMADRGWWDQDEHESNSLLSEGSTMNWVPALQAYMPEELAQRLHECGLAVVRVGGLGSLANLLPRERLPQIMANSAVWERFIDLCERFDLELMPGGPGTWERAGLIGVAKMS